MSFKIISQNYFVYSSFSSFLMKKLNKQQKKKLNSIVVIVMMNQSLQSERELAVSFVKYQPLAKHRMTTVLAENDEYFQLIYKMSKGLFINLEKIMRNKLSGERKTNFTCTEKFFIGMEFIIMGETIVEQCSQFGRGPASIEKARWLFIDSLLELFSGEMFNPATWKPWKTRPTDVPMEGFEEFSGCIVPWMELISISMQLKKNKIDSMITRDV